MSASFCSRPEKLGKNQEPLGNIESNRVERDLPDIRAEVFQKNHFGAVPDNQAEYQEHQALSRKQKHPLAQYLVKRLGRVRIQPPDHGHQANNKFGGPHCKQADRNAQ